MEPMECQYHANCGGWCETEEEQDYALCVDCLQAMRDDEEEELRNQERKEALQRIAVAVGISMGLPKDIADKVCLILSRISEDDAQFSEAERQIQTGGF